MSSNSAAAVLVERPRRELALLQLSNPGRLNSFTRAMWVDMMRAIEELQLPDSGVRCIVIRGADNTAFAAGSDIREFRSERMNIAQARDYGRAVAESLLRLEQCDVPLIASIRGPCVGGGLAVASLCDLRIAGESSSFGVPVNRLGLVMSPSEMRGLHALAGPAVLRELLLEGKVFGAVEAHRKGLVSRVVADADVEAATLTAAEAIMVGAPLVARWHKRFVRRLTDQALPTAAETEEAYACFATQDYLIGLEAFEQKHKPTFLGR